MCSSSELTWKVKQVTCGQNGKIIVAHNVSHLCPSCTPSRTGIEIHYCPLSLSVASIIGVVFLQYINFHVDTLKWNTSTHIKVCGCLFMSSLSMFSNFYRLYLHNKKCVGLANLLSNIYNYQIEIRHPLISLMVIGSRCLLIPHMNTHVSVIVLTIECRLNMLVQYVMGPPFFF